MLIFPLCDPPPHSTLYHCRPFAYLYGFRCDHLICPEGFSSWVSPLAYPNLFGTEGFIVVVVVVVVVVSLLGRLPASSRPPLPVHISILVRLLELYCGLLLLCYTILLLVSWLVFAFCRSVRPTELGFFVALHES